MNRSIISELENHIIDLIEEGRINDENLDDAHHIAFNEDYYIIGYYEADQWLKSHNVTPWQAMQYVVEQENFHFGESQSMGEDVNSESIVNLLVFFSGYDIDIERIYDSVKEG